ncbi:MAG: serine/threonine-protein kinase, partial [Chloroflexota bacterium]
EHSRQHDSQLKDFPVSASLVGQKLGKYEITALLGQGGMATVYRGYQRDVDRSVAVKVLPPQPGQNSQFIERFRLEARTIARLQHPHILPLYDYGDENDVLYLVMAYADGGSLSDRIRRGPMPLPEIQRFFQQVAEALDYAHRQNVIHRDIKPDNILLDREGHVLLSDFGIVKIIMDDAGTTVNLTATGGLVGTPSYMSPEQAQGLPVNDRTDIYSLGIVVYEMLTGKQPFSAETPMQVVLKHITAPVPPLRDFNGKLPSELDGVLRRALEKEPAQRYPTAKAFYDDFIRVIQGEMPLTPSRFNTPAPTSASVTYPSPAMQSLQPTVMSQPATNPLLLLGGFAIIALLIVAVVALMLSIGRPPTVAPTVVAEATIAATIPAAALPTPNSSIPNFGTVTYSTSETIGDTVNVQVMGLVAPPSGSKYRVWLYNTGTTDSLMVGDLKLDALGNGQLSLTSSAILPILYNAILITPESGSSATPDGKAAYSGSVPAQMMGALREILITSPDGLPPVTSATPADGGAETTAEASDNSSLLAGALDEAGIGVKHAGLAANAVSVGSLHTHNEHTINILRGTLVDYNGDGQGQNPGHGDGIAYFTDRIQAKLNAIVAATGSDHQVQSQVDLIGVCLLNVNNWVDQIVTLETQMLSVNSLDGVRQQQTDSTQLAAAIVNGVDLNKNGQVEPFEGECGLNQIDDFGISVANMVIVSGALPQGE